MTSEDVRRVVEAEIGDEWDRTNLHGCDLPRCLVDPQPVVVRNPFADHSERLWLVLEETPGARDGYRIVYDAADDRFGLAYSDGSGPPSVSGFYRSFLSAFDGM